MAPKAPMSRSLYWKLVGTLMAVLLFSTVTNAVFVGVTARGIARNTQEATLGRFARYASRILGYALSTGARRVHIPDLLQFASQEFPHVQIVYAPLEGGPIGTADAEPALFEAARNGTPGLVRFGAWPRRAGVAPVWVKGRPAGHVAVAVARSQAASAAAAIHWSGFLVLPFLFGLSAVLGLVALRFLRRRLEPVSEVLGAIRAGDLSQRLPEQEPDEVGQLFTAFNEMVARVEGTVKRLAEVDKKRRDFLVEVAHELKTPLTAVEGSLEAMMLEGAKAHREEHLARAYAEAVRIRGLVADLLESARMEEPRYSLTLASTNLQRLLSKVIDRYRLVFERRGIRLKTEFTSEPIALALDERRMEQVTGNLLQNALDHTASGCTLMVRVLPSSAAISVEFADDGEGMAPERLEEVKGGRCSSKGSGVGLLIVRKLVEMHGGSLAVDSEPLRGTKVTITLAAGGGNPAARPPTSGPAPTEGASA